MREILGWVNILCSIFCFLCSIAILRCKFHLARHYKKVALSALPLTIATSIWCLSLSLAVFNANEARLTDFFLRFSWNGCFIVASYFFLTLVVTHQKRIKLLTITQFFLATVFFVSAFTPFGIKKVVSAYPLVRETGPVHIVLRVWIILTTLYCLFLALRYYQTLPNNEKLKFRYYNFSISLFSILAVIISGVLPLTGYETLLYFAPLLVFIVVATLIYSIEKYRLLDINFVFYDFFAYGLLILSGLFLNFIIYNLFYETGILSPLWSSFISVLIVLTIFFVLPVKEKIKNTIRKVILGKKELHKKLLDNTIKAVIEILDFESFLNYVLQQIHKTLKASKIAIFLLDKNTLNSSSEGIYRLAGAFGLEKIDSVYIKNQKIINWLKKYNEPFLLDIALHSLETDEYKEFVSELHMFGAVIVIPINYKNELVGILTLDQIKTDGSLIDIDDIEALKAVADHLAIAVENRYLFKELNDAYIQITRNLSVTFESKSQYLVGHSDFVVKYALLLCEKLGLSEKEIFVITQAAILHDLGKIAIHDYILNKMGKLTKEEWEEIKTHPMKAVKILESLPFLKEVSYIIMSHHERYDGKGYPNEISGEEIPLGARILALADAVDAMLSERPYREPKKNLTIEEVIVELEKNKGSQFDPILVEKFLQLIKEHPEMFRK